MVDNFYLCGICLLPNIVDQRKLTSTQRDCKDIKSLLLSCNEVVRGKNDHNKSFHQKFKKMTHKYGKNNDQNE